MANIIEITDNNHLYDLIAEFDSEYKTSTFFVEQTLSEIWDNFYAPSHPDLRWWANTTSEYTHEILTDRLDALFNGKDGTKVNKDEDVSEAMIGKINSMYLMKLDILNDVEFRDPMCASIFLNGNRPVHPGGTRMNWANHYNKKIKMLVTSYIGTPEFKVAPYQEFDFDLKGKNFSFMTGNSVLDSGWASYRKAANNNDITYKQIQNLHTDYQKFLRPNEIEDTVTFELRKNKLYVNDTLLAEKSDIWRLVLND